MSTAKKRTVKYTAFATLLVLTLTYFSLLSPTSAYFYKTETKQTTIEFAAFDVDAEQTVFDNESVLKFKGATKLCDTEELLFDDVALVKEVTLVNSGKANARILTHITPDADSVSKGLRYIAFIEKLENEPETVAEGEEETTTSVKVEKGAIKTELEALLEITPESSYEDVEAKLNAYNEAFRKNDDILLAPGERAKVKIIFWSEYDPVQAAADTAAGTSGAWQNAGSIENIEYLCHVEIIATQDNDEAVTSLFEEKTTVENTTVEETTEQQ